MSAEGPYVQIATFCEAVRRSERGNMIIENCVTTVVAQMPAGPISPGTTRATFIDHLVLALSLWSGELKGDYTLRVTPELPGGQPAEPVTQNVTFLGGIFGIDLELRIAAPLTEEGTYWFSVLVSGGPAAEPARRVARVPLELRFAAASA
jgi:hypothetical protein